MHPLLVIAGGDGCKHGLPNPPQYFEFAKAPPTARGGAVKPYFLTAERSPSLPLVVALTLMSLPAGISAGNNQ